MPFTAPEPTLASVEPALVSASAEVALPTVCVIISPGSPIARLVNPRASFHSGGGTESFSARATPGAAAAISTRASPTTRPNRIIVVTSLPSAGSRSARRASRRRRRVARGGLVRLSPLLFLLLALLQRLHATRGLAAFTDVALEGPSTCHAIISGVARQRP